MSTQSAEKTNNSKHYLQLLLGPLSFAIIYFLPLEGLDVPGKICIATYIWMIVWWAFKPIPWIATCLLPLLIFPVTGMMSMSALVSAMFGQRIMFLLMFLFLLGTVSKRVGIGHRLAMNLLSMKWVNGKIKRFVFVYMIVTAVLQALFGPAGAAMAVPIGVAVIEYIYTEFDKQGVVINKVKFGSYVMLASAYANFAGCQMTIQGAPQNILVLSIYEELLKTSVSYFQWLIPGLISGTISIFIVFFILNLIYKFPVDEIPGGSAYFQQKKEELGKMTVSEKRLIAILALILTLWIVATFVTIPGVEFYSISYFGMLLLFLIPHDTGKTEGYVTLPDVKALNWDVIFLVTGAIGYSGLLTQFGIIEWLAQSLGGLSGIALLLISTFLTAMMTNLLAGMATASAVGTLILPLILDTGIHPLVVVKVISVMAVGLMVPWAGTAAAIFFGSQHIDLKEMFKIGLLMAVVLGTFLIAFNMLLMGVPAFFPVL